MTEKDSGFGKLMSYKPKKEAVKVPKEQRLHLGSLLIVIFLLFALLLVFATILLT